MKVNMTPNPLDVVTIHASQGDTEARQWEFELHNNGELIDTSDVKEQMFFKAYKGGTEQILPENTSTPTTSPFIGDIRYPQGLLTDQEFTYRQSPTEEDGLAKITDIKGNTLVWNQLVQNGNFESTSGWTLSDSVSASASNNVLTATIGTTHHSSIRLANSNIPMQSGRKYLFCCDINPTKNTTVRIQYGGVATDITSQVMTANVWGRYSSFANMTATNNLNFYYNIANSLAEGDIVQFRNCMLIDLTQMGLDISSPSDFTSLFSLPYYAYNQGTLLSFMGNGIKTVGKNLNPWQGVNYNAVTDRTIFLKKGDYVLSTDNGNNFEGSTQIYFCLADSNGNNITNGGITSGYLSLNDSGTFYYGGYGRNNVPFTLNFDAFVSFGFNNQKPTNFNAVQLEFGSTATAYEPYTSSTLSLPISTYFPNGMKSAGSVYDELTPRKAITRIGAVDLGTLDWRVSNGTMYANLSDAYLPSTGATVANAICPKYTTASLSYVIAKSQDKILALNNGQPRVNIYDSAYTDAVAFKTAMDGVILYYELATPTETSFTTASLVTENGEVSLANENGVLIGKCNSDVSADAGFIEGKIKLSDENGDVYSNKIQIHVERSPQ